MPLLTREQFQSTFGERMHRIDVDAPPPIDFWPYFDAIPSEDFHGHDCSAGKVDYAWRSFSGCFEHVLVASEDPNIFMVVVLDLSALRVHGHRLLDLNQEYGLRSTP